MTPPNSLRRPAIQIASLALVVALTYGLGYRQGSQSAKSESPEALARAAAESEPTTELPSNAVPPTTTPRSVESVRTEAPIADQPDWQTLGYEAALDDLDEALRRANSLDQRDQEIFVSGLFAYIAEHSSPRDALTIANEQEANLRGLALKTLAAEWSLDSNSLADEELENRRRRIMNVSGARLGLEVELASIIAQTDPDPSIADAWIDAFADRPGRSQIAAVLIANQDGIDPDSAFAIAENWTDWEKNRFSENLLTNWARKSPSEAWNWYSENSSTLSTDQTGTLLDSWAMKNPDDLIQALDTIEDSGDRGRAIEAISAALAHRGTEKAINWASSLATETEIDLASQAIYKATPKGIGALLRMENGFPKIGEILPGGALESTDIQAGDLIVESREPGGSPNNLYGIDLRNTVDLLRGNPGSEVEIRVLRENQQTGQIEEHTVTVVRDLLILDPGRG